MQTNHYLCTQETNIGMIVANKTLLNDFVQTHAQSAKPLNKWLTEVESAQWKSHAELNKHSLLPITSRTADTYSILAVTTTALWQ